MARWRIFVHARGLRPGSPHGARVGENHPGGAWVTAIVAAGSVELAQREIVRQVRLDLLGRGLSPDAVIVEDTRPARFLEGLFRTEIRYEFYAQPDAPISGTDGPGTDGDGPAAGSVPARGPAGT